MPEALCLKLRESSGQGWVWSTGKKPHVLSASQILREPPLHPAFTVTHVPINQPKQATEIDREPSKEYAGDVDRAAVESEILTSIVQSLTLDISKQMTLDSLFTSRSF